MSALDLLFVSHSLPPSDRPLANLGGMQRVAAELHGALRALPSLRYDAILLRASWRSIHWRTPLFLLRTGLELRRRLRRDEVRVVLFSSMVTAMLAPALRRLASQRGTRLAAIVHGLDVTTPVGPYQWILPRVFAALDRVLPVSAATGRACLERGLDAGRLSPVRNGVDLDRFGTVTTDRAERRRLLRRVDPTATLPPEQGLVLVSVGRHVRRKGFEWFVRNVMPLLPADVHYWIAGQGPETKAIESAVRELCVEDRVALLGRLEEDRLRDLLRGGDLFMMPNIRTAGDMEGFGVVLLEAGLGGMPSIGARLEGIAEVIRPGENGHVVETGDAGAFARAVLAYHGRADRLIEDGLRAHHTTRERYGWTSVARDCLEAVGLTTGGPTGPGATGGAQAGR